MSDLDLEKIKALSRDDHQLSGIALRALAVCIAEIERLGGIDAEIERSREAEIDSLRARVKKLEDGLRAAYKLIVAHHDAAKMRTIRPGLFCPVCHHDDGTEPEMDAISGILKEAEHE